MMNREPDLQFYCIFNENNISFQTILEISFKNYINEQ